jgi:formate dehydrogenase subunit delta
MSSDKMHNLIRMANQIADYFKIMPEAEALKGAADHLRAFWTPKMRAEIVVWLDAGGEGLNPLAAKVIVEVKHAAVAPKEIATG